MTKVDEAALKKRARAMLIAMTDRAHWVYALPHEAFAGTCAFILAQGLPQTEVGDEGRVVRYGEEEACQFVVMDNAALDATLVDASGEDSVDILKALLDQHGFLPQSVIWETALDVAQPKEASFALRMLAHMTVAWDADISDVFLLHLASPDAVARHEAVTAVTLAAMVARDVEPALLLLQEAKKREKFPKLSETISEAIGVLRQLGGQPVDLVP